MAKAGLGPVQALLAQIKARREALFTKALTRRSRPKVAAARRVGVAAQAGSVRGARSEAVRKAWQTRRRVRG